MKKLIHVLFIILIMFTAIGCNSNNAPSVGGINITINNGISRGIQPNIPLDVAEYIVRGSGPNDQEIDVTISPSLSSYFRTDLRPGEWVINVYAVNSEDKIIGSDSVTITVKSGQTTEARLTIRESEGEGRINVSLTAPSATYNAVISKLSDGQLSQHISKEMDAQTDGSYSASFSLMNGYYTLSFTSDNTAVSLPAPVAFRIVKDDTLRVSFNAKLKSDGFSVTINDNIVDTPVLALSKSPSVVGKGENISIYASSGDGSYDFLWYVDGQINSAASGSSLQISFQESGIHEISCIAADASTGIYISARTTVMVNE